MLHLPSAMPDETLYSLLARIANVNGMARHLLLFDHLFQNPGLSSIVQSYKGLPQFCITTNDAYGSVESILSMHSSYPLLVHLQVSSLKSNMFSQEQSMWLNGGQFDDFGNGKVELRTCPTCCYQDQANWGFTYWKRSHQLSTSYCCHIHGEPLNRKLVSSKDMHERFWLPCEVEEELPLNDCMQVGREVMGAWAGIGRDGLADRSTPYNYRVIRNTFMENLQERGLLTRSGRLRMNECIKSYAAIVHSQMLALPLEIKFKRLLNRLANPSANNSYHNNIILVHWLFGSWNKFKECCRWQSTMDTKDFDRSWQNSQHAPVNQNYDECLKLYRRRCLDYIDRSAEPERAVFLKLEYKSFRWLLHYDSEWLNRQLPLHAPMSKQGELFGFG